jgi:hypothetical protein
MAVAAEHLCTEAEWKWELPDATEVGPVPFIRLDHDAAFQRRIRRTVLRFQIANTRPTSLVRNTRSPRELPANVSASARRAAGGRCGSESFASRPGRLREGGGSIRCLSTRENLREGEAAHKAA